MFFHTVAAVEVNVVCLLLVTAEEDCHGAAHILAFLLEDGRLELNEWLAQFLRLHRNGQGKEHAGHQQESFQFEKVFVH